MKIKRFICWLFGHHFIYGDWKGIQSQPTLRACKRCEKVQHFHGEMTSWPGTCGQLWYARKDWFSAEEFEKHTAKENELEKLRDTIVNKKEIHELRH